MPPFWFIIYAIVILSYTYNLDKINWYLNNFKFDNIYDNLFHIVPSYQWFAITIIVYAVGLVGIIFNNNNFLVLALKIELMFIGIIMFFIGGAVYCLLIDGFVFALLTFGVVTAESALGLSLFLAFYLENKTITFDSFNNEELLLKQL